MDSQISNGIIAAIKEAADRVHPPVRYVAKYGGEVLAHDPASDTKFVGGIFTYEDHVSLELSKGAEFADAGGHLEGKGKARRHLKLRVLGDVAAKDVEGYLRQAFGG